MKIYRLANINFIRVSDSVSISGWILPDGEFVNTGLAGHELYIEDHCTDFGIKEKDVGKLRDGDVYDFAFKKGCIRIAIFENILSIEAYFGKEIRKQIEVIHKLVKNYRIENIYVDLNQGYRKKVTIEELYKL